MYCHTRPCFSIATRGPGSDCQRVGVLCCHTRPCFPIATRGPGSDCQRIGVLRCQTRLVLDYLISLPSAALNCILSIVPVIGLLIALL